MGFLSRMLVPRSVRRVAHPVRSTKRVVRKAVVPKPIRQATYIGSQLKNPVSAAMYHGVERPMTTAIGRISAQASKSGSVVYRHGSCPVKHRSPETAARCRNR